MPLELTDAGLTIQGLEEIVAETGSSYRTEYGDENLVIDPDSFFGRQIGIQSEREAKVQQVMLSTFSSFDPRFASGRVLDSRAALTNTFRKPSTKSKSTSFLATGVAATAIENGKRFRLTAKEDEVWIVADGPFVIGGGGTIAITAEAENTGPQTFNTTGPGGWTILTPVAGWTTVESTADLDPEDTGQDVENDPTLRVRRKDSLLKDGNDLEAIRVAVQDLLGVTSVATFENNDCTATVDGIPPGAFEVVVDGGLDADIAAAIYANKPPGAESFGTILTSVLTSSGQLVEVGHTRPVDIDLDVEIDVTATGAEFTFPINGIALIEAAFLEAANAVATINRDQYPPSFIGVVFDSVKTDNGQDTIVTAEVRMRRGASPFTTAAEVITLRQRADYDSANISVTVL